MKVRGSFISVDEIPDCREVCTGKGDQGRGWRTAEEVEYLFFPDGLESCQEHALSPELSVAASPGGQGTVAWGLCAKIDKGMRNDLLEWAWPNLLHLEVQWESKIITGTQQQ